jgi:predicted ATP-dependent Lon-type protease
MHELRKESFVYSLSPRVTLSAEGGDLSIRDQKAIQRVASGVMKLLSPHDSRDREVMEIAVGLAVEYRQRVHEWLCSLSPGEYKPKKITFALKEV